MRLKNTSASQVTAWDNCHRLWHYGWAQGIKAPPSPAMQRGTFIHKALEELVTKGEAPDNEWKVYADAAAEYLPLGEKKVLVEQRIELDTAPGLPYWLGYIDLLDDSRTLSKLLRITDHKTTSDFRYAKTPYELSSKNSQLNSYARYAFENGHSGKVEIGHLYLKTAKKTPKKPKILPVYTTTNRQLVNTLWEKDLVKIEAMVQAAEIEDTNSLEPNTDSCNMYGGCPHRARCGLSRAESVFQSTKGKGATVDFLKKLAAAKKKNGAVGKGAAAAPTGVLPSDGASRETAVEAKTEAPEAPTETKAPKKKAPKKKKAVKDGFCLYIDCTPVKDVNADLEPTLFEDWVAPIYMSLNEVVMETKSLPDFRLLPYSEEKAMFAIAVKDKLDSMPQTMVVQSGTPGAKDALGVLIPHASTVVRALRG